MFTMNTNCANDQPPFVKMRLDTPKMVLQLKAVDLPGRYNDNVQVPDVIDNPAS